jgi:hypothetical protein
MLLNKWNAVADNGKRLTAVWVFEKLQFGFLSVID